MAMRRRGSSDPTPTSELPGIRKQTGQLPRSVATAPARSVPSLTSSPKGRGPLSFEQLLQVGNKIASGEAAPVAVLSKPATASSTNTFPNTHSSTSSPLSLPRPRTEEEMLASILKVSEILHPMAQPLSVRMTRLAGSHAPKTRPQTTRAQPSHRTHEKRRPAAYDSEDDGYSSSDMEASYADMQAEETRSARIASREDAEEERREREEELARKRRRQR